MAKMFLALNGDKVGEKISQAVLSNDPEQVRNLSASFNQAHTNIDQWVEKSGGRVIMASGDEAVYELDSEKMQELESILSDYAQATGHTITAGVGADILQSVKAMVYGKMHDAGQIIEYSEELDQHLTPNQETQVEEIAEDAGEEMDDSEMDEGALTEMGGVGDETPEDMSQDDESMDDEELEGEELEGEELEGEELEGEDEEPLEDMGQPEDDSEMTEGDLLDDAGDDMDAESEDDELEEMPEAEEMEAPELMDESMDDESMDDESMDDESMDGDERLVDGQNETEDEDNEPMEMGEDDQGQIPDLSEDEVTGEDQPMDAQEEEEEGSPITEMMHANMDEGQDGQNDELKQRVMQTLMSFKENKEKIEQMKTSQPEMYASVIEMLNRMIELARQFKASPEAELAGQQMADQIPQAEEGEGPELKKPMGRPM